MSAEGRASDFIGGRDSGSGDSRRGKVGRTLRSGSPVSQEPANAKANAKPVRLTVDLNPELHRFLKLYAVDAGAKGAEVVRALLEELRDEPELSERVLERISGTDG